MRIALAAINPVLVIAVTSLNAPSRVAFIAGGFVCLGVIVAIRITMKKPIHRAIAEILRPSGKPMSVREIHDAIIARGLYSFQAHDTLHIVRNQLRRHCKELSFRSERSVKYFTMSEDGRFALLERPLRVQSNLFTAPSTSGQKATKLVSVPTDAEEREDEQQDTGPSHSEIQWRLLDLGVKLGLTVWAPYGDRGKVWKGQVLGTVDRMLNKLPLEFAPATMKTIENIDVLWLEGNSITAGFEVEHTSQIYSGLLRMCDLLTMHPNIIIKFYLVAPDNRQAKFMREIARPTFSAPKRPLHSVCSFLPYTSLLEKLDEAKNLVQHLRPEFLDDIAEPVILKK